MRRKEQNPVVLKRDLSEPLTVPEAAIDRAVEIMRSGRLFRYGEFTAGQSEVAALEREFAVYLESRYAVAMNSCGSTMFVALKCAGVGPGDRVLVNAFTLAPVPGAIEHVGAQPMFLECGNDCRLDLADLELRARKGAAKVLLISHMRGHIADLEAVNDICRRYGVLVIEDCAHTMGASWKGRLTGTFGSMACFSLQTFKHVNAGEGGLLITDDDDLAAKAILFSGSYMFYDQNGTRPSAEVFERYRQRIPNCSLRMPELTAALARPQIELLSSRAAQWKRLYSLLAELFDEIEQVRVPCRPAEEDFVPSSIQFSLEGIDAQRIEAVLDACGRQGVDIKWFGRATPLGFTSCWEHWQYVRKVEALPRTRRMLDTLCDMRIPLTLTPEDCRVIADILREAILAID